MKKYIVYNIILAMIFSIFACDPTYDDIYDEIDANKKPIHDDISFTFTADDYATASGYAIKDAVTVDDTTNAENIEEMEAFNMYYTAEEYIPFVIEEMYNLLKDGSVATVTYNNYIGGLDYLDNFGNATAYELVDADYEDMGPGPGGYHNFSSYDPPEDYLPDWLLTKYPAAVDGDMVAITYDYYSGSVSTLTDYYSFDGTEWIPVPGVYVVTSDDFSSMGGYPGSNDRFAYYDGEGPEDYLPIFLKIKYPYSADGDKKVMVYDYYIGGGVTVTNAQEYHYDGSVWTKYDAIVEVTNQFIHNGEGWVFDPTVTHTMVSDDYQTIVDYVKANIGEKYIDSYGTGESYYGAGAYYENFSISAGYYDGTVFEKWEEAVKEAIGDVLLPALYPDATTQVNGVDMFYKIVFETYSGSSANYVIKFQVTKSGPNPEFTYIEGPTPL